VETAVDSAAFLDLDPWAKNIALDMARSLEFGAASRSNVSGYLAGDNQVLSLDVALHSPTLLYHDLAGLDTSFDQTIDVNGAVGDAIADDS
jgi:hypothetical protein